MKERASEKKRIRLCLIAIMIAAALLALAAFVLRAQGAAKPAADVSGTDEARSQVLLVGEGYQLRDDEARDELPLQRTSIFQREEEVAQEEEAAPEEEDQTELDIQGDDAASDHAEEARQSDARGEGDGQRERRDGRGRGDGRGSGGSGNEGSGTPAPTPTPSPTAEPTPTATPSATPSVTPTPTPSATPSATPTATPSATPTAEPIATPDPDVYSGLLRMDLSELGASDLFDIGEWEAPEETDVKTIVDETLRRNGYTPEWGGILSKISKPDLMAWFDPSIRPELESLWEKIPENEEKKHALWNGEFGYPSGWLYSVESAGGYPSVSMEAVRPMDGDIIILKYTLNGNAMVNN